MLEIWTNIDSAMSDDVDRMEYRQTHTSPELEDNFREWMMVKKPVHKCNPRPEKPLLVPNTSDPGNSGGVAGQPQGLSLSSPGLNSQFSPNPLAKPFEFQIHAFFGSLRVSSGGVS